MRKYQSFWPHQFLRKALIQGLLLTPEKESRSAMPDAPTEDLESDVNCLGAEAWRQRGNTFYKAGHVLKGEY